MVSIQADVFSIFDPFMAPSKTSQSEMWIKVGAWVIGGLFLIIGILIGVIWDEFSDKLKSIETTLAMVNASQNAQGQSLARIEERTRSLERSVYKSKAVSLGFKNPEIVMTSLSSNAAFESHTSARGGQYFIRFTILSYDPISSLIKLRFDAALPNGNMFEDNMLTMRIRDGEVVELTRVFLKDSPTKIYLQVIDATMRNQAVLAIGPKQDNQEKVS